MRFLSLILYLLLTVSLSAQKLPLLKVSGDKHFLQTEKGEAFFWLGGTAWEMIHRLTREECKLYLQDRAGKGFNVLQTVILAELDGLTVPNAYGDLPLIDQDPTQWNEAYFQQVDKVVKMAAKEGLYVALLPTWGDKFNLKWGVGPEIFTPENAETYGAMLARRYLKHNHIIWVLGGDRLPENEAHFAIIRAMAKGIRSVDQRHLITYHPQGGKLATDFFADDDWLDLDMFQSGHDRQLRDYTYVQKNRRLSQALPVINAEPRYENIPDRFWVEDQELVWMDDADIRSAAWWSMMSGAAGFTYGCNDIWQMYQMGRKPEIYARTGWQAALELPGSTQMGYMKTFFEAFPWQKMQADSSLILNENPHNETHMIATMDVDRAFILVYTPFGNDVKVDIKRLGTEKIEVNWFNPRSGQSLLIGTFDKEHTAPFTPPSHGRGSDYVLVLKGK